MLSDDFKYADLAKRRGRSRKGANPKSTPKEIFGSHGHKPAGKSILWPALYRHLRAKGYSKAKAAAISNSAWNKKRAGLPTNTPTSVRGLAKHQPGQHNQKTHGGVIGSRGVPEGFDPSKVKRKRRKPTKRLEWVEPGSQPRQPAKKTVRGRQANPYFNKPVKKADDTVEFSAEAEISKVDTDKRIVFGWAYQCIDENGEQVIDKSGEFVDDPEELENTAYDFVLNSRQGGADHARTDDDEAPIVKSTLVESMMFTDDKKTAMGLPDSFPTGWWVGFRVHDPETWSAVKKGHYRAFSVHGRGVRKEVTDDDDG